ncbi:hypothetical protein [Burkholderia diffusa]|uniref:glycine-rich domain-containing protein n=1 Tax=Burkholderia diffusa TaxID=488732 RepID=UPI002ABE29BD|nr:hypothetical protein [Burkholderia diffusa]
MGIIGTLPANLQNGTTADASQVMADLNFIVNQVNANGMPIGTISVGALVGIQIIPATGPYTANANAKRGVIDICGGAGAGGGAQASSGLNTAGSGGGAAASARIWIPSNLQSYSGTIVTIGAGGTGVAANNGNAGGATTFGALISCGGGVGGIAGLTAGPTIAAPNNATPAFSSSLIVLSSQIGDYGSPASFTGASNSWSMGGKGGSSPFGSGGVGECVTNAATPTVQAGSNGTGYGAGGGGAAVTIASSVQYGVTAGFNGSSGIFIIYEFA